MHTGQQPDLSVCSGSVERWFSGGARALSEGWEISHAASGESSPLSGSEVTASAPTCTVSLHILSCLTVMNW